MPHRFFISNEVKKKVLPSKARQVLISLYHFLLDLLFPWRCLYCQKAVENDYPLCESCFQQIPIFDDFLCPVCQKRLSGSDQKHHSCQGKTHFTALGVVSLYENPILKETLHYFKYRQIKSLVQPLSLLMIQFLENSFYFSQLPKNNLLIIPLPLHLKKKKQRGFNQSELIAQKIADYFHFPLCSDILLRIINNPAQVNIKTIEQRKLNVQGIFQVQNKEVLKNKIILLIDDVYTTGATMEEAAKTLKQNGVKKVIGLVLARG